MARWAHVYAENLLVVSFTLKNLWKDTANPLSHHAIASLNCLSSTQALAPEDKNVKNGH